MNILLATSFPSLPEWKGGMQSTVDGLALSLAERGHKVSLLCGLAEIDHGVSVSEAVWGLSEPGIRARWIMKLTHQKAARDRVMGYPVWRAKAPWEAMQWVIGQVKPDVIALMVGHQVRMALAARPAKIPLLMGLQAVEFGDHGGSFADLGNIPCIANSQFTADRYREAFGVEPRVIHPIIDRKKYWTETTRENVTFINPHPFKGLDVALAVARHCPDIPFSFVQSWPLGAVEHRALVEQLAELPNVNLLPAVMDMRQIYGKCRILIAPSRWQEAYGRVVTEAQYSGIPVIASNRGGLPEAVGSGGLLLAHNAPTGDWVSAAQRLWYDDACYSVLSAAAYAHSKRPALNQVHQLDMWENTLFQVIEQHRRHSVSPSFVAHPLAQRSFSVSHQD